METGPILEVLGVLVKALGITIGMMAFMTIALIVFLDIWAKRHTAGKIYAFFFDQRSFFAKLLKAEDERISLGRGERKEEYFLDPNKQFWVWWPPGLPRMIQVPVRAHLYVRNVPTPYDPSSLRASLTSKALRMISDEAMLRQTWKDVRESVGMPIRAAGGGTFVLIMLIIVLLVTGYNLWVSMSLQKLLGG